MLRKTEIAVLVPGTAAVEAQPPSTTCTPLPPQYPPSPNDPDARTPTAYVYVPYDDAGLDPSQGEERQPWYEPREDIPEGFLCSYGTFIDHYMWTDGTIITIVRQEWRCYWQNYA